MGQKAAIIERELTVADGVPAFVAEPPGAAGAPRVVIAPEIFGLSPWIRSVARRLAAEGLRVIAPEIFAHDPEPLGSGRPAWMARIARLDIPHAVDDLRAALAALPGGKAGAIGFCLGGALSLLTAAGGDVSACVDCYGRVRWAHSTPAPHPIDAARGLTCPVLGIFGRRDPSISVADAEELGRALPAGSEIALYDAGHAFLNDTRPDMHVEAAAALAWPKIVGFLRRNLG